jgi:hypothetical protein
MNQLNDRQSRRAIAKEIKYQGYLARIQKREGAKSKKGRFDLFNPKRHAVHPYWAGLALLVPIVWGGLNCINTNKAIEIASKQADLSAKVATENAKEKKEQETAAMIKEAEAYFTATIPPKKAILGLADQYVQWLVWFGSKGDGNDPVARKAVAFAQAYLKELKIDLDLERILPRTRNEDNNALDAISEIIDKRYGYENYCKFRARISTRLAVVLLARIKGPNVTHAAQALLLQAYALLKELKVEAESPASDSLIEWQNFAMTLDAFLTLDSTMAPPFLKVDRGQGLMTETLGDVGYKIKKVR